MKGKRENSPTVGHIKAARAFAKLTQAESAELLSVTRVAWHYWETGQRAMPIGYWELYIAYTQDRLPAKLQTIRQRAAEKAERIAAKLVKSPFALASAIAATSRPTDPSKLLGCTYALYVAYLDDQVTHHDLTQDQADAMLEEWCARDENETTSG
jgi:DNA-binding XRE family transcriptional regulator